MKLKFTSTDVVTLILGLLIIFGPLAKGGMIHWVPTLIAFLAMAAFYWYFFGADPQFPPPTVETEWLSVLLVFSGLCCFHLFLMPRIVSWNAGGVEYPGLETSSLAINMHATLQSWVLFCCYWSIVYLASKLTAGGLRFCLSLVLLGLLFQAGYGVISDHFGQHTILGVWPKTYYVGSATGTFVNHNHFANYIAICIPPSIVFLVLTIQHQPAGKIVTKWLLAILVFVVVCLSISALISSKSRMGFAVGGLGLMATAWLVVNHYFQLSRPIKVVAILSLAVLGMMMANFWGVEQLLARYSRIFVYEMRWEVWAAMFELPISMWVLGTGGGTFFDVFLQAHPPELPKTVYYAHNDYLQFFLEYGALGGLLLAYYAWKWLRVFKAPNNLMQASCTISVVVMAIHGLVDFSLHLPANAMIFWFFVGAICNPRMVELEAQTTQLAQSKTRRKKKRRRRHSTLVQNRYSQS